MDLYSRLSIFDSRCFASASVLCNCNHMHNTASCVCLLLFMRFHSFSVNFSHTIEPVLLVNRIRINIPVVSRNNTNECGNYYWANFQDGTKTYISTPLWTIFLFLSIVFQFIYFFFRLHTQNVHRMSNQSISLFTYKKGSTMIIYNYYYHSRSQHLRQLSHWLRYVLTFCLFVFCSGCLNLTYNFRVVPFDVEETGIILIRFSFSCQSR